MTTTNDDNDNNDNNDDDNPNGPDPGSNTHGDKISREGTPHSDNIQLKGIGVRGYRDISTTALLARQRAGSSGCFGPCPW